MRLSFTASLLNRFLSFSGAALFCVVLSGSLNAATISFTFATPAGMDATFSFLDNPATTEPYRGTFLATIVSPQLGTGILSVPSGLANNITGLGHSDYALFNFAQGSFTGTEDSTSNATGGAAVTYLITAGTGAFAGAKGTVLENAQFTSFGSYSPAVPGTVAFTGSGTLTVSPEPGTVALLGLGLAGLAVIRARTRKNA